MFPTGGVIPGRVGVIQLEGWTSEQMTVRDDAGVVLNWPAGRGGGRGRFGPAPERSEEDQAREANAAVRRIEEFFEAAAAYHAARRGDPHVPTDIRLEAMGGLFGTPEAPATRTTFINAQEYDQILAAAGFATRLRLKAVIVGGRDAPQLADMLKARGIGVIVTGTFRQPRRNDSPYDDAYTLPARLEAAGVKWCLASGDETPHERNLPYAAGLACAHGLARDAALRSITLSAAELLGVADKLGSLETGKLATLIVTDGDPLEITTKIERAFIARPRDRPVEQAVEARGAGIARSTRRRRPKVDEGPASAGGSGRSARCFGSHTFDASGWRARGLTSCRLKPAGRAVRVGRRVLGPRVESTACRRRGQPGRPQRELPLRAEEPRSDGAHACSCPPWLSR